MLDTCGYFLGYELNNMCYDFYFPLIPNLAELALKIFIFIYLFILFSAALALCCCARAFSSCGERELFFLVLHGLLIVVDSLVTEHRLQAHGLR